MSEWLDMVIMYCTVPAGAPPHDNAGLTPPSPDRHVFANGSISESAVITKAGRTPVQPAR